MRMEDHIDRMLDRALEMTFPASDPISVYIPEIDVTEDNAADREKALVPETFQRSPMPSAGSVHCSGLAGLL